MLLINFVGDKNKKPNKPPIDENIPFQNAQRELPSGCSFDLKYSPPIIGITIFKIVEQDTNIIPYINNFHKFADFNAVHADICVDLIAMDGLIKFSDIAIGCCIFFDS